MSWRFIFLCLLFCLVLIAFPLLIQAAAVSTSITVTVDDSGDDDDAPAPSGGGGGGGGGAAASSGTNVILQGKAYPNAPLTILKDGQIIVSTKADPSADFKVTLTTITPGVYTFGIWAEDKDGARSITFSFTVTVRAETITTISGIFIPPTITLGRESLNRGDILDIYGQTAPESKIDVYIYSEEAIKKTQANQIGVWAYPINTSFLTKGAHMTKVKSSLNTLASGFSQTLFFYLDQGSDRGVCQGADLNNDGRVNLIDFSILLYWWDRANDCADQNHNGIVDLADFSIMMYWWTG